MKYVLALDELSKTHSVLWMKEYPHTEILYE